MPGTSRRSLALLGAALATSGASGCTYLIALLRRDGIPARAVRGVVLDDRGGRLGMHQWAEAWVGRWIPVDASFFDEIADAWHVATEIEGETDASQVTPWGRTVRVIREIAR